MSKNQKLVIISDTHLHTWSAFGEGTGSENVRLQRTLGVIRRTLDKARELDAVWVHAGDWIHSTGFVEHPVASPLIHLLCEYPDVSKITVWGNHDSRTQGGKITLEETFLYTLARAIENLHVLNGNVFETENGLRILGVGAQNDIRLVENTVTHSKSADVGIFHQLVASASFPSGMVTDHGMDPDFLRKHFRLSILGDIHKPHLDTKDGATILIPGSSEPHNFGDHGERGFWAVTLEEEANGWVPKTFEDIESGSPKFLTVLSADEIEDDYNYYRVLGTTDEDLPDNVKAIRPSPNVVEVRDLLEGATTRKGILERWLSLNPPEGSDKKYLGIGLKILKRYEELTVQDVRVKHVRGENFFSYESLDFPVNEGVTLIIGRSDSYESNGAGKSTIPEAIYWALFGKTTKGVAASDVIRWGTDNVWVEVTLDLAGKELVVHRSRTANSIGLTVTLDGQEVTGKTNTDLSNKLEELLGLTPELTKALAYFSQEDPVLLSQSTDADLKQTLADLRGLASYQKGAEEAGELARNKETEENKYATTVETLTREIERDTTSLEEAESKSAAWEEERIERLEKALDEEEAAKKALEYTKEQKEEGGEKVSKEAQEKLKEAEKVRARVAEEELEKAVATFTSSLAEERDTLESKLQYTKEKLPASVEETTEEELKETENHLLIKLKELTQKEASLKAQEQSLRTELDKAVKKKKQHETEELSDTCPTCGQNVDISDAQAHREKELAAVEKEIDELLINHKAVKEELDAVSKDLTKTQGKANKLSVLLNTYREFKETKQKLAALDEKKENALSLAKEKAERKADASFADAKQKIKEFVSDTLNALEKEVTRAESAFSSAQSHTKSVKEAVNPHQSLVESLQKTIKERRRERWSARRRQLESRRDKRILLYWANAFGKTGIQSLLMEDIVALFNKHRGNIFPTLTRGKYDVQMSAVSRTQSGDEREKTEFRVFQDGTEVAYNALSGGQRRRIDLGVLLTMTMAASKAHGVSGALGLLILDEVCSYLDQDGAEALAETLREYTDVVPSIYVVSQDLGHKALYDNILVVEQDSYGVSRIVNQ